MVYGVYTVCGLPENQIVYTGAEFASAQVVPSRAELTQSWHTSSKRCSLLLRRQTVRLFRFYSFRGLLRLLSNLGNLLFARQTTNVAAADGVLIRFWYGFGQAHAARDLASLYETSKSMLWILRSAPSNPRNCPFGVKDAFEADFGRTLPRRLWRSPTFG